MQHQVNNIRINMKNEEQMPLEIEMWIQLETLSQLHAKKLALVTYELKWTNAMLRCRVFRLMRAMKAFFSQTLQSMMQNTRDIVYSMIIAILGVGFQL